MKSKLFLAALLAAGTFLTSCDKDDDKTPSTGSLKATVTPAASATRINVIMGTDTVKATPSNGVFTVDNLKAGKHTVIFTPAATYEQPAPQEVNITGGQTTDMGTITITKPGPASMSAKIGGSNWNSIFTSASNQNNQFTVGGANTAQTAISIVISNINGAKTYTGSEVNASVLEGMTMKAWMTGMPGSTATVNITKLDMTTKKASGTFTFTAVPVPGTGASGNKVVTDGVFSNVSIQ